MKGRARLKPGRGESPGEVKARRGERPGEIKARARLKTWQSVLSFTGHSDGVETVQLQTYDATKLTGLVLSDCKLSNTGTLQGMYNYDDTFLIIDIMYNAHHCFIVEGKPSRP